MGSGAMQSSDPNCGEQEFTRGSRRKFLMRNIAAITAIAATAASSSSPASAAAKCGRRIGKPCGAKCFMKGTKILTSAGERNVEDLAPGDMLPTMFGGERPIQSIGRFSYKKADSSRPWARQEKPIRIARSALGPNTPHRDLFVSSGHALFIDGVLVLAGNLVNGHTITAYDANEFDELEFYHIKLESHDVVYAEGAACETLSGEVATAAVDEAICAPLIFYKGRRGMIQSRMRSAVAPWLDMRNQLDLIRDRLELRGVALLEAA